MIEVRNLYRQYCQNAAIKDLSIKWSNGKIYSILGPCHSGKSTLLHLFCGALLPQDGKIRVNGFDIEKDPLKARKCIGFVSGKEKPYPQMSCLGFLSFVAEAKGLSGSTAMRQIREALSLLHLETAENKPIASLSSDALRRLNIAQALIGNPEFLILDNPFSGLNDKQMEETKQLLSMLAEKKTVIFTAESREHALFADQILLLLDGEKLGECLSEELSAMLAAYPALEAELEQRQTRITAPKATQPTQQERFDGKYEWIDDNDGQEGKR